MISTNNEQLTLIAADKQFIDLINNRITGYGQIPYSVPEKLIIDIIIESARMFYRQYWRATETQFYRLEKEAINDYMTTSQYTNKPNLRGFLVRLPSYVSVVKEVHETNASSSLLTSPETLVENTRISQQSSRNGNSVLGINNHLYIIETACRLIEEQAFESIFSMGVNFRYNNLTHTLSINQSIQNNLVLEILGNVNIQLLYNDDLFIRHVIGRVKQELKRIIAGHTIELPGGATLNADEICNNLEDVEKVEELLRAGGGIGDIIMMR